MTAASSTADKTPSLTYRVGAAGSGGVWLGMGMGRVAVLGVGLLTAIAALTGGLPIAAAIVPVLVAVAFAGARVAGRPLLDWLVPLTAHCAAGGTGTLHWRTTAPTLPLRPGSTGRLRLPSEFGRPRLEQCPDDPAIGMVLDPSTRSITVVFDVCGPDRFPLLDDSERDGLIAGWGEALAVLADTDDALTRLQLIERAHPAPALTDPAISSGPQADGWQRELAALATGHDSRLAAQWVCHRLDGAAIATIVGRAQLVSRTLLSARLLTRPLTASETRTDILSTLAGPVAGGGAAALSRRADWTQVRLDDRFHRSFAVASWPTGPVGATWLSPLLLVAPEAATRTVALHLERVTPAAAARVARTRRAKAVLDQSDRARFGMTSSAALEVAEAAGVEMDAELAAGYRTHRLAGVVTLSADTVDALDQAGRALRQAAALCRIELRPLHGQHDLALAATAPLCRMRLRGSA
jgi:hypothetical protein